MEASLCSSTSHHRMCDEFMFGCDTAPLAANNRHQEVKITTARPPACQVFRKLEARRQMVLVESIRARSREVPRIETRRPVALVTEDGYAATAVISDISPGGMQICCDRANAYALNPSGAKIVHPTFPRVDAHFTLPVEAGLVKIDVECRMVYFSELLMEYLVGFSFCHFKDYGFLKLDRFIREVT